MKLLEFVRFDSKFASLCLSIGFFAKYFIIKATKDDFKALLVSGDIFRYTQLAWVRRRATKILQKTIRKYGSRRVGKQFFNIVSQNIDSDIQNRLKESFLNHEQRPFDKRLLILSPPVDNRKGVILIKFTDYFKYVLKIFDMEKLSKDYVLIVEPSFCGYFDEDILCLMSVDIPIIIQSSEPVDFKFIEDLSANLFPIQIGANWWINDKAFYPINNSVKIYDVIIVAIWADFKRHYHLFETIAQCKKDLKIVLVGRPWPKSIDKIKDEARFFNVLEHVTFFEDISQQKVNELLNESKCLILLSKKEGFNKSIIEAMYADIPVFLLEGHNFGYHYPFINSKTGGFINPRALNHFLENIDDIIAKSDFSPQEWIRTHISAEISTDKIVELLKRIENEKSVSINKRIHVKVNSPELNYYDETVWKEMEKSYRELCKYLQ